MNETIKLWGSSLALRIPNSIAKSLKLREGSMVDVTVQAGQMIVKPAKGLTLSKLLRGITRENRHSEKDWGIPVGREIR